MQEISSSPRAVALPLADAVVEADPTLARRPGLARLQADFAPIEEEGDAA